MKTQLQFKTSAHTFNKRLVKLFTQTRQCSSYKLIIAHKIVNNESPTSHTYTFLHPIKTLESMDSNSNSRSFETKPRRKIAPITNSTGMTKAQAYLPKRARRLVR